MQPFEDGSCVVSCGAKERIYLRTFVQCKIMYRTSCYDVIVRICFFRVHCDVDHGGKGGKDILRGGVEI